jgi:hypothetical protein
MAKPYEYTRDDLAALSGWQRNTIDQEVKRGLKAEKIEEVSVWLAEHGPPEIRKRMAEKLLPVLLDGIGDLIRDHLPTGIFREENYRRKFRGAKISKTKLAQQNGKEK